MSRNTNDNVNLRRKRPFQLNLRTIYSGVPVDESDAAPHEKPWQRVPCVFLILVLGWYLLLGYLTQLVEDDMPRVITENEVARDDSTIFSEEAAWRYLYQIMGDQPRVAGTSYHLNKTVDMKALVDSIALGANQNVRTDWQIASGDYYLAAAAPFVNFYENVSNVVAVLEGESGFHSNGSTASSILLNCHYDSVPYALGASDNVVFCAAMVETLSKLARRRSRFKHNIVFLFNGAEENPLQGSHAFLQHPWSHGVSTVVNLDSAGMNGKPTVFQVTDPRVLDAYKRSVSRPNAQGLGEFLFSSGIIPSDTDFRIWRDFGNMQGIDIAFVKWGHVYHTRHDHPAWLLPGVVQCSGDMLLALTTRLADMEDLNVTSLSETAVYYDFLNVSLFTYSLSMSYLVDVAIAALALLSVAYYIWLVGPRASTIQELLWCALGRVLCLVAGVLMVAVFTPIMVATTVQMRYLTQPWLVVAVYWIPYLIGAVSMAQGYDAWRTKRSGLNRSIRTLQAQTATRLLMCVALLILICVRALISMRYLISAPLWIMSLVSLGSLTLIRYASLTGWQHLIVEISLSLPSAMFTMSLALRLNAMMLPIMARSGGNSPDYTVAMLNVALAVVVSNTVSGIELLFSRKRLWMVLSALGVASVVLMFIPFSPYSEEGPSVQRHYWFHTQITTFDVSGQPAERTSGVMVSKMDPYSASKTLSALSDARILVNSRDNFMDQCRDRVYCDLPLFRTSFARNLPNAMFVYSGPPAPFSPEPSVSLTSTSCDRDSCTYNFVVIGAYHNVLTLWPREGVNVTSWSLQSAPAPSFHQLGRPVFVVFHSVATYNDNIEPLSFSVNVLVPESMRSQPAVDVSLHAHKIHHPEDYTPEYRRMVDAMPNYFHIASFMTYRHNYVF